MIASQGKLAEASAPCPCSPLPLERSRVFIYNPHAHLFFPLAEPAQFPATCIAHTLLRPPPTSVPTFWYMEFIVQFFALLLKTIL
jgi:hypothetical protein